VKGKFVMTTKITRTMAALGLAALSLASLNLAASSPDPSPKEPSAELFLALKGAMELATRRGDALWPGYGKAPFGFLLVKPDRETLLCDPRLPDGFVREADDPLLKCKRASGPSSWRKPSFLAAMPVFGPPSLIVMGTPKTTGRSLGDWKITILHEHFHQWQADQPGYYDRVAELGLSGGDETGMWMLNYAFPYGDTKVGLAHARASVALGRAISAKKGQELTDAMRLYRAARTDLQKSVSERDWRYFEFQLWQEGVARWTEFTLGAMSKDRDARDAASLSRQATLNALANPKLSQDGRIAVYALGAGEAMLLDRIDPKWRRCYLKDMALGPRFSAPCR
jgi:hypothetical protein